MSVELKDVAKSFIDREGNQLEVLKDLSFFVAPGEIVTLIGPSGCGKTTTLRIIAGLVRHDMGEVLIDGKEVQKPGQDRGFVFQDYGLMPWLSVRQNIEFGLAVTNAPKEERRQTSNRLLKIIGMERFPDFYPHELSGGMQQRVGLARALAIDPKILLMDEPLASLDAQTRIYMRKEVLRLVEEMKKTVVYVTHDLEEAISMSQRILVLEGGGGIPSKIADDVHIHVKGRRSDYVHATDAIPNYGEIKTRIWNILRKYVEQQMEAGKL
ncbi:MAG: ABC transporter ATP-binding protein [Candidatus Hodarchaeota archaeon]